jgi:hypothetical protein
MRCGGPSETKLWCTTDTLIIQVKANRPTRCEPFRPFALSVLEERAARTSSSP